MRGSSKTPPNPICQSSARRGINTNQSDRGGDEIAERAIVEIDENEHEFTAQKLDSLILKLGERRARMRTSSPRSYASDGVVKAINDPNWSCEIDGVSGVAILSLRDPRFGWLTYALSSQSSVALIMQLIRLQSMMKKPSSPN